MLPKATASVWKNPPERFKMKAFDTDKSPLSEKLPESAPTISLAPENASFLK